MHVAVDFKITFCLLNTAFRIPVPEKRTNRFINLVPLNAEVSCIQARIYLSRGVIFTARKAACTFSCCVNTQIIFRCITPLCYKQLGRGGVRQNTTVLYPTVLC